MPRRSASSLSVVPIGLPARPSPPKDLTPSQRAQWQAIVDQMPPDYFIIGSLPLLAAYVRAIDAANTIAEMIRATDPDKDLARYSKLLEMSARETKSMCSLAQKMRLSQAHRFDSRKRVPVAAGSSKPWEQYR